MHDYDVLTRRLADLVVGFGANVQPGQLVGVTSYLGKEALTRQIARAAYERGARSWTSSTSTSCSSASACSAATRRPSRTSRPGWSTGSGTSRRAGGADLTFRATGAPRARRCSRRPLRRRPPALPARGRPLVNLHTTNWSADAGADAGLGRARLPGSPSRPRRSTASGERSRAFAVSTSPIPWQRGRPHG